MSITLHVQESAFNALIDKNPFATFKVLLTAVICMPESPKPKVRKLVLNSLPSSDEKFDSKFISFPAVKISFPPLWTDNDLPV